LDAKLCLTKRSVVACAISGERTSRGTLDASAISSTAAADISRIASGRIRQQVLQGSLAPFNAMRRPASKFLVVSVKTVKRALRSTKPSMVSAGQAEALVPEFVHRVIEVRVHALKRVRLVRVRDLLEQDVLVFQGLGERHRLLVMHVVVPAAVYQHELFALNPVHSPRDIRAVVTGQVVLGSRQPHVPFRVNGV